MAQKLTQRGTNPNPLTLIDLIHAVSVADTTQSAQGSSYKNTLQALANLMKRSGMGNFQTVAPTVSNDITQGYTNGTFWYNTNTDILYILKDQTAGSANWLNISSLITLQIAYDNGNNVNGADVIIDGGATHIFAVGLSAAGGNTGNNVIALGSDAALNNSGDYATAIGEEAAKSNTGFYVVGIGSEAAKSNIGNYVNAMGRFSAEDNTKSQLNAIGFFAGYKNTGFSVNAIGGEGVGLENTGDHLNAIGGACGFQNTGDYVNAIGTNAGRKNTANNSNFFGRNAGYDSVGDTGNTTSHGVTVFSPESIPSFADQAAADAALTVGNGCVAGQIYLFRNEANDTIGYIIP
jgi:hypothetical protein